MAIAIEQSGSSQVMIDETQLAISAQGKDNKPNLSVATKVVRAAGAAGLFTMSLVGFMAGPAEASHTCPGWGDIQFADGSKCPRDPNDPGTSPTTRKAPATTSRPPATHAPTTARRTATTARPSRPVVTAPQNPVTVFTAPPVSETTITTTTLATTTTEAATTTTDETTTTLLPAGNGDNANPTPDQLNIPSTSNTSEHSGPNLWLGASIMGGVVLVAAAGARALHMHNEHQHQAPNPA